MVLDCSRHSLVYLWDEHRATHNLDCPHRLFPLELLWFVSMEKIERERIRGRDVMGKDLLALKIEYVKLQKSRKNITEEYKHYCALVSKAEAELDSISWQQRLLQEDYDETNMILGQHNDKLDGLDEELEKVTRKIEEIQNVFQEQGLTPSQVYSMEELEKAGQFTMSQHFEG